MRLYRITYTRVGGQSDWMEIFAHSPINAINKFVKIQHETMGIVYHYHQSAIISIE